MTSTDQGQRSIGWQITHRAAELRDRLVELGAPLMGDAQSMEVGQRAKVRTTTHRSRRIRALRRALSR